MVVPWTNALAESPAPFSVHEHISIEGVAFAFYSKRQLEKFLWIKRV